MPELEDMKIEEIIETIKRAIPILEQKIYDEYSPKVEDYSIISDLAEIIQDIAFLIKKINKM